MAHGMCYMWWRFHCELSRNKPINSHLFRWCMNVGTMATIIIAQFGELVRYSLVRLVLISAFTQYTISRSSKNSNNVRSMCNMSGQCAWPGLQLNYFVHSSSSHNRMGVQFSTSSVEQLRLLITDQLFCGLSAFWHVALLFLAEEYFKL